jgi:hypothetical protein
MGFILSFFLYDLMVPQSGMKNKRTRAESAMILEPDQRLILP